MRAADPTMSWRTGSRALGMLGVLCATSGLALVGGACSSSGSPSSEGASAQGDGSDGVTGTGASSGATGSDGSGVTGADGSGGTGGDGPAATGSDVATGSDAISGSDASTGACGAGDTNLPAEPTMPAACATLHATQNVAADGVPSETSLDTSAIQAALESCASGQAVKLTTGSGN